MKSNILRFFQKKKIKINGPVVGRVSVMVKFAEPKTSDLINGSTVGFAKKTIGFDQRINGRLREKNHILINGSTVKKTIGFDQRINGRLREKNHMIFL